MNNDLNITEEEYKQINEVKDDDSIKVNHKNIKKVSNKNKFIFFILLETSCFNEQNF